MVPGNENAPRSSFPTGLDNAVEIARAIHNNAGLSCTIDQLAAYVGQSATSGAFRLNLATARIFGLTESEKGQINLTDIGRRVVDPELEHRARAEAFLHVPLYGAIYNKYKQGMLPPTAALEREMAQLGVSTKQTDKARQAFDRSATQAGFFAHGRDRLVMPVFQSGPAQEPARTNSIGRNDKRIGGGGGDGSGHDPLITGLIQRLPEPDSTWSVAEQARWLELAAHVFAAIYKADPNQRIEIKVFGETPMACRETNAP